jgi:isopenicillin N synthase-like dioxygenase
MERPRSAAPSIRAAAPDIGYHQLHNIGLDRQLLGKSVGSGEKQLFVQAFRDRSRYERHLMHEKEKLVHQRRLNQLQIQKQVRAQKLEAREVKNYKEQKSKREDVARRRELRAQESKKRAERKKCRKKQIWYDSLRTRVSNGDLINAWEAQSTRRHEQVSAASALAQKMRPNGVCIAPQFSITSSMINAPSHSNRAVAWGS